MAPVHRYRTCVICGIRAGRQNDEKRKFMTRFPFNPTRCREWVKLIGNEDLAYIPIKILHHSKYVCGDHFLPQYFNRKKTRLKKNAIPTESINAEALSDKILEDFPCHISKPDDSSRHTIITIENLSSLADDHCYSRSKKHDDHNYSMGLTKTFAAKNEDCPKDVAENVDDITDIASDPDEHNIFDEGDEVPGHLSLSEEPKTTKDSFSWNNDSKTVPLEDEDVIDDVLMYDDVIHLHDGSNEDMRTEKVLIEQVHENFQCNICEKNIVGFRYVCLHCPDYDICSVCETRGTHALHYMLRVPGSRPFEEVQSVLGSIRRHLFNTKILSNPSEDIIDSIKLEPKDEIEDVFDPLQSVPESIMSESPQPGELNESTDTDQEQEVEPVYEPPLGLENTLIKPQKRYIMRKTRLKDQSEMFEPDAVCKPTLQIKNTVVEPRETYNMRKRRLHNQTEKIEQVIDKKPTVIIQKLPVKVDPKIVLEKKCLEDENSMSRGNSERRIASRKNIRLLEDGSIQVLTDTVTNDSRSTDNMKSIKNSRLIDKSEIGNALSYEGRSENRRTILIPFKYLGLNPSEIKMLNPNGEESSEQIYLQVDDSVYQQLQGEQIIRLNEK